MNADSARVLAIVERAFPYVERPTDAEIPFHTDACAHCEMTLKDLRGHSGEQLPASAIRWLCDELSTLSAKATAWILPVYLRYVLTAEDPCDPRPTEFLIYALSPAVEHETETRMRLALLNGDQFKALGVVIAYWKDDPYWSEHCPDALDQAAHFLATPK